jgi:bacteriocin-like protein
VGQTMDGLDESTTANVLKGLGGEALEYMDAEEAFNMGMELTEMSDENLATIVGGIKVDGMTILDGMSGFGR